MFDRIAKDSTSGASSLARRAARELSDFAASSRAQDPGSFWEELVEACRRLIEAKREMAPIINLVGKVLATAERLVLSGVSPETIKHAVQVECAKAWESGEVLIEDLGRRGAELIGERAVVATTSASDSVRSVLASAKARGSDVSVILSESRPNLEGVAFARVVSELGVPVTVVADAALPGAATRASVVIVGADSVSEDEFVNKIGTYALALAARAHGVPFYVAALLDKFIPGALRGDPAAPRPPGEILSDPAPGVTVENRYFERVPLELASGIITEEELMEPRAVASRLRTEPVAPALLGLLFPPRGGAGQAR